MSAFAKHHQLRRDLLIIIAVSKSSLTSPDADTPIRRPADTLPQTKHIHNGLQQEEVSNPRWLEEDLCTTKLTKRDLRYCAVCQLLRRTFKNHREWLENCGADLDRKLQNAMKSSERCLFFYRSRPSEVLEGLLAAATTKRLTAHGVRKFCRRSHITKNKGEPNGTCADQ